MNVTVAGPYNSPRDEEEDRTPLGIPKFFSLSLAPLEEMGWYLGS